MNKSQEVFKAFLAQCDRLQESKLGPDERRPLNPEHRRNFVSSLQQASLDTRSMFFILCSMLFFLFGLLAFVALYSLGSPLNVVLLTLAIGSQLTIIARLWRLAQDKHRLDLADALAQELPPEELVRVIEVMYWSGRYDKRSWK